MGNSIGNTMGNSIGNTIGNPVSKPSSLNSCWLNKYSQHHLSIHDAWPYSRLLARLSLCSNKTLMKKEYQDFAQRARGEHLTKRALNSIILHDCDRIQIVGSAIRAGNRSKWFSLPYGPALNKAGTGGRLSRYFCSNGVIEALHHLIGGGTTVRIAWSNNVRNVISRIGGM